MKLIEIPAQTSPNEIDEEILEIFVEEVGEVLESIITCFSAWRDRPEDQQALKDLRRSFHTLKGSGRLVGATAIGELGWRFEFMLNQLLEGRLERSPLMLELLDQVEEILPQMIEQFKDNLPTPYEVILLISQVDYFTQSKGEGLGDFASESPVAVSDPEEEMFDLSSSDSSEESDEAIEETLVLSESDEAFSELLGEEEIPPAPLLQRGETLSLLSHKREKAFNLLLYKGRKTFNLPSQKREKAFNLPSQKREKAFNPLLYKEGKIFNPPFIKGGQGGFYQRRTESSLKTLIRCYSTSSKKKPHNISLI